LVFFLVLFFFLRFWGWVGGGGSGEVGGVVWGLFLIDEEEDGRVLGRTGNLFQSKPQEDSTAGGSDQDGALR